ncbi:MAG: hypothetical protein A2Z04_02000 [Chloroflexi bacterium RBG_16_57_9]|nr:MAG: hypothetical protein A2Z04_02000 [Chloroflexi bacterium RBG_16_57_9]
MSRYVSLAILIVILLALLAGAVSTASAQGSTTYRVRSGDTLNAIGLRFGVSAFAIAQANGLRNPNLIFPGQVLIIPAAGTVPVSSVEAIIISRPARNATITSPVRVTGTGQAAQHNELAVHVLDEGGNIVGQGTVHISGQLGRRGPFSGDISFNIPSGTQVGAIQVFDTSPRDGHINHLNSVDVKLRKP